MPVTASCLQTLFFFWALQNLVSQSVNKTIGTLLSLFCCFDICFKDSGACGRVNSRSQVALRGVGASALTLIASPGVAFTLKALLLFHDNLSKSPLKSRYFHPAHSGTSNTGNWWGLVYIMAFAFVFLPQLMCFDWILFVFGTFVMLGFPSEMLCMLID